MLMTRLPACIRPISLIANCYLYTRELSRLARSFTILAFLNFKPRWDVMMWLTLFLVIPETSVPMASSSTSCALWMRPCFDISLPTDRSTTSTYLAFWLSLALRSLMKSSLALQFLTTRLTRSTETRCSSAMSMRCLSSTT